MIPRTRYLQLIQQHFEIHTVCGILGPRQCGKTTLAKQFGGLGQYSQITHFDLEDPIHLARLMHPKLALEPLTGLVVIDEIQRKPELFPILRVLADQNPNRHFLILGSTSRDMIQQSSESLAGRIGYLELPPLQLFEIQDHESLLWERGGFPKSYLAKTAALSDRWRLNYIKSFLERDLNNLGFEHITTAGIRRLLTILAHYHGNLLNYSELGNALDLSHTAIRKYIDILEGTFMIRRLTPWFENISKRQIKSPKIYIRDSGLLHSLLGLTADNLFFHQKLGASWEGFAMESVIHAYQAEKEDCYFWGIQSQAELDLLIVLRGKKIGFEFKYSDHPSITRSMKHALNDLKLDKINIIIPGQENFALSESIQVTGLSYLCKNQ